jgi:hypothetical protein
MGAEGQLPISITNGFARLAVEAQGEAMETTLAPVPHRELNSLTVGDRSSNMMTGSTGRHIPSVG